MPTQPTRYLALSALLFATAYVQALPNDLLIHEQWGLHNAPRPSPLSTLQSSSQTDIRTCAEKPTIGSDDYSCNSFTEAAIEDMDINAPEGWAVYSPSPTLANNEVVIALIDTGIDYGHPDLAGKIWLNPGEATGQDLNNNQIDDGCEDNIDGDNNGYIDDCHGINALVPRTLSNGTLNPAAGDPLDDSVGHGTNMAGVMAAAANNRYNGYHGGITGVAGIEPNIKIATCKSGKIANDVLPLLPGTAIAAAEEAAIVQCLQYFLDLKQRGINIAVVNASGGMSRQVNLYLLLYTPVQEKYWLDTPMMYQLANQLEQADIVVVAAAGNLAWNIDINPYERAYFPAAFPNENIIAVGAINNRGQLWSSSSYGRWSVDVLAPGQTILSTNPRYPLVGAAEADFVVSSGTSQATAYVAGMAALLRANAATAHLDAKAIRRLLMSSGKPLAGMEGKTMTGALVRLADSDGRGALTCHNQIFRRRQSPQADDKMVALPGETITLEVQNFNCAAPGTETSLTATVAPIGATITLLDDGTGADRVAGDGIYSATWTVPHGHFEYTLSTGWDSVKNGEDTLKIQASIIVDNDSRDTDQIGNWIMSIYRSGYYGSYYRYAAISQDERRYIWSPVVAEAGHYRVYSRAPQSSNFASNAHFIIHHQDPVDGTPQQASVFVNQTRNGGQWVDMGAYWFPAGTNTVELTNVNANGTVVADAIQLVPEP